MVGLASLPAGCELAGPAQNEIQPLLTEIARQAPELSIADACVLADFDRPFEPAAVRLIRADGRVDQPAGLIALPDDPGRRGLAFTLEQPGDAVVVNLSELPGACAGAPDEYGTLVTCAYLPDSAGSKPSVRTTVRDGRGNVVASATTELKVGANVVRVDLEELFPASKRHSPQSIWLELPASGPPVSLILRGIAMAGRAAWAVGGPETNGFRVCQRAGRVFVSFVDGQQLTLANGIIWRWYPTTGINAAAEDGLGPLVQPENPSTSDGGAIPEPAGALASCADPAGWQMKVVEASAFRSVVEACCKGQPAPARAETENGQPDSWRQFTIYPDGRVYVVCDPRTGTPNAVWVLAVDGRAGFERSLPPPGSPNYQPAAYVHLHADAAGSELLWVPADTKAAGKAAWNPGASARHSTAVVPLDCHAGGVTSLVWFLAPSRMSPAEIEQLAADYQRPATIRTTVGKLRLDAAGDLNRDGFNESEGCYELEVQRDRLHFAFDPAGQARYSPVFRVDGTQGKDARVYVNGRPLSNVARDYDNRLLFSLPDSVRTVRYVEVYVQP